MPKQIIIVGAGISGLAKAWFLKKRFGKEIEITLLEKSHRPGGWIKTIQEPYLFELGPRGCSSHGLGRHTLEFAEEIGLKDQILFADPHAKSRFLYTEKKLQQVPNSLFSILTSPLTRKHLHTLLKEPFVPKSEEEDETISSFISRRLSSQIAEQFFDPLASGIYSGDIKQLSMKLCFPKMYEMEKEEGSLIKAGIKKIFQKKGKRQKLSPLFTFKKGMEVLPQTLSKYFNILYNQQIESISPELEIVSNKKVFYADELYLATPQIEEFEIVKDTHIPSVSIGVVNLAYEGTILPKKGFGYLIPSSEKEQILGVVWDSLTFPEQNLHPFETRMTVMIKDPFQKNLVHIAQEGIERHLGISNPPIFSKATLQKNAIPQYHLGHAGRIAQIQSQILKFSPHIYWIGNSVSGISVNECIFNNRC